MKKTKCLYKMLSVIMVCSILLCFNSCANSEVENDVSGSPTVTPENKNGIENGIEITSEQESGDGDNSQDEEHEITNNTLLKNGLARVEVSEKWGYIDESGSYVINLQFDSSGDFYDDGYAVIRIGEKCGIIDETGKYIVNPQFDYIFRDFAWSW